MDELRKEEIDQGEGEEDGGGDADEVEGRGNRREEENRTTLPEAEEAAEEECIDIKKAKYRLRIHELTTVQYRTVHNSTVIGHNDIREPPFFSPKHKKNLQSGIFHHLIFPSPS